MKRRIVAAILGLTAVFTMDVAAQDADRIWGRVLTTDGDTYEGFIRWDRNEANWADVLDGTKRIRWTDEEEWLEAMGSSIHDREQSIEFLGVRVTWDNNDAFFPSSSDSGIRFGHIERLTVDGRQTIRLRLRSGDEIELSGGSTDIGPEIRELLVEEASGTYELEWRDLDEIEFFEAPATASPESPRLFGTVEDRNGNSYTGFISWDLDEVLGTDILDGEEDGDDREIPFFEIAGIERLGRRAAIVTFGDGSEMELRGSNDVASGHRGVQISDPGLGLIDVPWDEFDRVRFHEQGGVMGLSGYDGGHRLFGTVTLTSGEAVSGWIRWDADEEHSWEFLNGSVRDVVYDVEFGNIHSIERRSWYGANVTLLDGRVLELEDSNDVDENNRGIFVETQDGERFVIEWADFALLEFEHR